MKLHFLGGADTVTGSQHIIEASGFRVLRDCGLYQGRRKDAERINRSLPFDVSSVDATVLSHAHIDHCGNLPTLAASGYTGPIYATRATVELCDVMLHDSARIQEQDAAYLNQKTSRRGWAPVDPLYTVKDAESALKLLEKADYGEQVELGPGVMLESIEAGHILGAALSIFNISENGQQRRVGFAVDLGRPDLPLIRDPAPMANLDVLVMESTYGNRYHADAADAEDQMQAIISKTLSRGGKVLIPSFALERAQEVIFHLSALFSEGRLPKVPVFVDSPMAEAVSGVFSRNTNIMDDDFTELRRKIGSVMNANGVHYTSRVAASKAVTARKDPCIVIAASGMCEHGRILHHLKHGIEDPRNTIMIVGYQAAHTLGRRLVEKQDVVRIFGDEYRRKAEVAILNAFSGHADRTGLINYYKEARPDKTFLVHGEQDQRIALAEGLRALNIGEVHLPACGDTATL